MGRKHARRGMTLLEVLIAFGLLLFGVLAVAEVTPMLLEGQRLSEQQVAAAQYAQYFMEIELKYTYAVEVKLNAAQTMGDVNSWPTVSSVLPGVPSSPVYHWNVYRTHIANGFQTQPIICINVQVVWMDPMAQRYGSQRVYSLVCYMTPPPLVP